MRGANRLQELRPAMPSAVRAGGPCEPARHPAAVSPRRAEARDLAFHDDDPEIRRVAGEVVGGPEAGKAGADDRDVTLDVAAERRPGSQRARHHVEPQAAGAEPPLECGRVGLGRHAATHGTASPSSAVSTDVPCSVRYTAASSARSLAGSSRPGRYFPVRNPSASAE